MSAEDEVNLADQFMPPSAQIGEAEARRQGLVAPRGVPRLEDLEPGPVAGPTAMTRAHRNGLRKMLGRARPWFTPVHQKDAETCLKVALLTYLKEWEAVYGEGTRVLGLSQTERTIMVIRQDTVQQIIKEIGGA